MVLKHLIESFFASWLRGNRFSLSEYFYDEEHFGNELAIYESSDVLIRFIADRGDIYIDVASVAAPSEWFLSSQLLDLLGHKPEQFAGRSESQIEKRWQVFNKEFVTLESMLAPAAVRETRRKIEDLRRIKLKQTFPEKE